MTKPLATNFRRIGLVVVTIWAAVAPLAAQAFTYPPGGILGRGQFLGYFENRFDNCGASVLDAGLGYNAASNTYAPGYSAAQFISDIGSRLFSGVDGQEQTGAAFIVLSMLGVPGPATGGNHFTGINLARSRWAEWVFQVNYYASVPGKVEWGRVMTYPFDGTGTYLNSMYQGRKDCGGPKPPDIRNPDDDAFYSDNTPQSRPTIIFHNSDTSVIMIKRNCANLIGPFGVLKDATFSYDPSLVPVGATPLPGGIAQAGSTLDLSASFRNSGTATGAVAGTMTYFSQYGGGAPSGEVGLGSDGPVGAGLTSRPFPFSFVVANGLPEGTPLCITARVRPHTTPTPPYDLADSTLCWVVYNPHYPGIIGQSGDIHAGGGLCGQAPGPSASINGSAQSKSLTEYVLSATGGVAGFGSNNVAGGTGATLGKSGQYSAICRPDLVQVARNYMASGGAYTPLPAGTYNVGALPASPNGVYIHNGGGNITLSGTFSTKITIVSLTGTVTISGPITLNAPAATGANVPSLGIISAGDLLIDGAATRVDAYLFSDGTINTCTQASSPACLNTLVVNGFLMAQGISFRRYGPFTGPTATVGEQINLTGQIYLNPPKFFDNTTSLNLLQNQGERPPLN